MRSTIVIYLLFVVPLFTFAQNNYVFQHLTTEDGLLSDSKINTFQDAEGFYWFNSISGIQRYDGKNFITYKYNNNAGKDILDNLVGELVEDRQKNIWIINKEGINILSASNQQLHRFYMPDAPDSNTNNVTEIVKDVRNRIWIFTNKNIFWYNDATQKPVLFSHLINNNDETIFRVIYKPDMESFLVLTTGRYHRVLNINYVKKQLSILINNVDYLLGHINLISFFKTDDNHNLWFGNYVGDLCRYNITTGKSEHYSVLHQNNKDQKLPTPALYDCVDDENGGVLFTADNYTGLLRYDKKTDSFSNIKNDNGAEYGFHYNEDVYSLFKDKEGNIWVNTDLGMNIFNIQNQLFRYVQLNSKEQRFNTDISSVFQSKNNHIWICTWGDGVFEFDSNFVLLKNYKHDNKDAASLGDSLNRTWCITEDLRGRIWIGSQFAMLTILNPTTGKCINKKIKSFNNQTILHAITDEHNNIWLSLHDGTIAKWDAVKDTIIIYKKLYKHRALSIIEGLCIDADGNIWAGTRENGLSRFNTVLNIMDENALLHYHIFSPEVLNDSLIIGGTAGNGFFIFNKYNKKVRFITTKNGLSSNIIFDEVIDDDNNIWLLACDGIERLDISTSKISLFDVNDGIHDHVFGRTICKFKNGTIAAVANSGIIYFDPSKIKTKPAPPDVTITGFYADQQNFAIDSLLQLDKIHLSHNQNVITIEFASLSFNGRKTNNYFYKLDGINKTWIAAGIQRSVTYANLNPDKYIFKVRSQNTDGSFTKNITSLSIIIYPPWWQTWWAYILWILIAAYVVYAIYDYRKRSHNALAHIRQKIASDLHDDIGSTLNSISIYSEVVGQQIQTNTENAKSILYKMGDASRNMIDTMNDIVWSINPKNDQFENILQRMQYFAGEILSGKNILLQFNTEEKVKSIKLPMEKRKNFYLIFKEAINNACKYSRAKNVNVTIAEQLNKLIMIITDDGIGFEVHSAYSGNGLKNMQARAKEINGELHISSWQKKGTRIELRMPLK